MKNIVPKRRYIFVDYLKVIAALLIINSHYDQIYPVSALATGGAIGNAIFFAVSGFCLFPLNQSFGQWMWGKLLKLYIPTTIMTIIAIFTYKRGILYKENIISIFIWPTLFWFVGAILLFYVIYYLLQNVLSNKSFLIMWLVTAIIYIFYYIFFLDKTKWIIEAKGLDSIEGYSKLIYYFTAMMIGKWFRLNSVKKYKHTHFYIFIISILFISIYAVKWLLVKIPALMAFQFLNQLSILLLIVYIFIFLNSIEGELQDNRNPKCYKYIKYLSSITLHLYLVQFLVIEYTYSLRFPVNFIIATVLILLLASGLNMLSNFIINLGLRLTRKKN